MAGGNDGAGSIRSPASYCGLFGLKPSRGRAPNGPDHGEVWDGASQNHVLTRSVRDSARMLDAIAGPELGGPFAIAPPARPFAAEVGAEVGRLRIGFSVRSPIGGRVEAAPIAAVAQAAKLLESFGHEVEEAAPEIPDGLILRCFTPVLYGHIAASMRAICARTGAPESSFHTDTRVIAMLGRTISAADFVTARHGWNELSRAVALFHQRYDIYLTPATAFGPARIGALDVSPAKTRFAQAMISLRAGGLLMKSGLAQQAAFEALERVPFAVLANMSFVPAMSVPLHWGADGLPVGVHFSAAYGAEGLLFRLGAQLEAAQPWAARRPPGFA
jgi:amidase